MDLAPTTLFANAHTMSEDENNCLLHALRHGPGQSPKRIEVPNLRANVGQRVMENPDSSTGGSSGDSFRDHIARDPASTGASTFEDYN